MSGSYIFISIPPKLKGIQKYAKTQLPEVHPSLLNNNERIY